MKVKKRFLIPSILIVILVAIFVIHHISKDHKETTYSFTEITRGDIENTVDATGTIEPVTAIEVGTQVSGIIDKIYVDFNDEVKRNQLMAVLDTTILSVQVRDARATLLRSKAQYDEAKYTYERTEKLYEDNLLSELEYITAKSSYQSALSSLQSAQNSLEKADRNMKYAFIRSPIDGTVIYRDVEEGQTVASSFSTPRLFLIAQDLSKMEIHALVDESEIGEIKVGQAVRFDVQAYDDKVFTGVVRQVWLQPETVQNVVNYTVVVDAENPDGLLLPGMTATLDFIIEQKKDILMVAAAALKLQPTETMFASMRKSMEKHFGNRPDSLRGRPGNGPVAGGGNGQMPQGSDSGMMAKRMNFSDISMLWYFNDNNELQMCPVKSGSTDGKNVEITPLRGDIKEGMKVIVSINSDEAVVEQNNNRMGGFGGPPPF